MKKKNFEMSAADGKEGGGKEERAGVSIVASAYLRKTGKVRPNFHGRWPKGARSPGTQLKKKGEENRQDRQGLLKQVLQLRPQSSRRQVPVQKKTTAASRGDREKGKARLRGK